MQPGKPPLVIKTFTGRFTIDPAALARWDPVSDFDTELKQIVKRLAE